MCFDGMLCNCHIYPANNIMGKIHKHTESTVGINKLECDVRYAAIGGDTKQEQEQEGAPCTSTSTSSWQEYDDRSVNSKRPSQ